MEFLSHQHKMCDKRRPRESDEWNNLFGWDRFGVSCGDEAWAWLFECWTPITTSQQKWEKMKVNQRKVALEARLENFKIYGGSLRWNSDNFLPNSLNPQFNFSLNPRLINNIANVNDCRRLAIPFTLAIQFNGINKCLICSNQMTFYFLYQRKTKCLFRNGIEVKPEASNWALVEKTIEATILNKKIEWQKITSPKTKYISCCFVTWSISQR